MGVDFCLANDTKKEYVWFMSVGAVNGSNLVTGGWEPELVLAAQNLLLLKDDLVYRHYFAIDKWCRDKDGLPYDFEKCILKISGRWSGSKIRFIPDAASDFPDESAASAKARAKHLLQSACKFAREEGERVMQFLKKDVNGDDYPKKGWKDVTCDVLLAAAAYRIAMNPEAPLPFRLDSSFGGDSLGIARQLHEMRDRALAAYQKQEKAKEAKKAKEAAEAAEAKKAKEAAEAAEAKKAKEAEAADDDDDDEEIVQNILLESRKAEDTATAKRKREDDA